MIEQITTTYVGLAGFAGFIAVVLCGVFIGLWIKKEMSKDDGA
jgi:hypothetical protein